MHYTFASSENVGMIIFGKYQWSFVQSNIAHRPFVVER